MLSCTQENHESGRYMQNRELSWLQFNERCMRQAKDPGNPLLERLRFLSIFTSNLDEFFMVRVGSLIDMLPLGKKYTDDKTGETAEEQLTKIYDQVRILYAQRDAIYQELEKEFRIKGVFRLKYNEMTASEQEYVENYFSNSILPMLSPMLVDPQHPFPHLSNKGVEICVRLRKKKGEEYFAFLPVPVDLPQILYLPGPGVRYIGMEDLLLELADVVFDTYTVEEKIQICITRNADIHAEDEDCEKNEDFRKVMQKLLKDRRRLAPLRLEMTDHPSAKMLKFLQSRLLLSDSQIFYTSGPLQMKYAYGLENKLNPEQNNIDWSKEFEKSGCTIMYGMANFKVHSKLCLITRNERGTLRRYTQIGTGNYNETTSKLYTDFSLMTADPGIGEDAALFFRNMGIGNLEGRYDHLLVAPLELQDKVIAGIEREMQKGSEGYLFFKLNSLTDRRIIEKLRDASCAGVKIHMIVRGICCLVPGIPGETENIEVRSIVGRYLEHSRIYVFGKGSTEKMYIASADFMTRNTRRRVEVGCPILDPDVREKIWNVIHLQWSDNTKAMKLLPERKYEPVTGEGSVNSQEEQMKLAEETRRKDCTFIKRIKNMVKVCN